MKSILKKFLVFLLCAATVFSLNSYNVEYASVEARTIEEVQDEIDEYMELLGELKDELAVINGNIEDLETQSGQNTALLEQYQAEIDALAVEAEINEVMLESYDMKRAEVIAEMALVREDYDYRVSMYKRLMQFIYENSETNAFELLFSAENISDYLTRRDNFNDIMNAANELIKEIDVSISDLELLDEELATAQANYEEYLSEVNRSKIDLETKVKELNTIASELNLDIDSITEQYSNQNSKIKEINAKLTELKEEKAKLEEEERIRREEERKKREEEERRQQEEANKNNQSSTTITPSAPSMSGFVWPVSASYYVVTSQYGNRPNPFGTGGYEFHNGLDIACGRGTPILAAKDGVVTRASWFSGYGNCVIIYHGDGVSSLYGHCDNGNGSRPTFEVEVGDTVKAGDVIAYVGTTGRSTGYHLHYGMMTNTESTAFSGVYLDPDLYLPDGFYNKDAANT